MPEGDPEKLQDTTATPDRERGTSTHHRNPGAADESIEGIDFPRLSQLGQDDESLMAMRRVARIRERNRLAQQRHRQKKKGERAEIEAQIDAKRQLLDASRAQMATLTALNQRLHQQIASISVNTCPAGTTAPAAEPRGAEASAGNNHASFHATQEAAIAAGTPDIRAVYGEVRTDSGTPHAGASSCRQASPHAQATLSDDPCSLHEASSGVGMYKMHESPKRALASRSYSVGVTYKSLVDAANACTSSTAPSRAASGVASDNRAGTPQGLVATIAQVQAFEAARRGCSKDDIAWYLQMPNLAAPGLPLSYTSALASPECITSMMLATIMTCIELCCCEKFMSSAGCEVTEGEVEGNGFHSGSTLGPEAQAAGKRLRFTSAADSNGGTSVHSSMSQIVSKLADVPEWPQGLGMSDALIDTMSMRCGVCEAVPLRQGVAHVFKDSMSRYRHFMSHEVILTVLLAVVQRQDSMIKSAVMNMLKSVESSSLAQEDSRDPCEGLLAATASNLMGLVVLLRREVLATARQLAGEEWSGQGVCSDVARRAQLEEQVRARASQLHHDFILGYALVMMDASRRMYQLLFDRVCPYIKSYAVDRMNANLFTELQLSLEQRRGMAEHWRQWKQRREGISTSVGTARNHLLHLPRCIYLPSHVPAHLVAASEPAPRTAQRSGEGDEAMRDAEEATPNQPVTLQMYGTNASNTEAGPTAAFEYAVGNLLFLGNDPRAIAYANAALSKLRTMHMQDRDMFVENLNAHMPGVYVNAKQALKMWASGPASENIPTDFLALCQIAATQQHRHDLFGHSNEEDAGSA